MARISILVLTLAVVACAPQTYSELYVPYRGGAGYGYSEQRLDDRHFVIVYNAPTRTGFSFAGEAGSLAAEAEISRAYEFALARAAEVALANGYPAFRVMDRKNDAMSQNYEARSNPTGPSWAEERIYSMDEAYLIARVTITIEVLPSLEAGAYDAERTRSDIQARYLTPPT